MFCKKCSVAVCLEESVTLSTSFNTCAENNHSSGGIWVFCISELAKKSGDMVIAMVTILL